ncbi:MAG: hypothetical protein ABSG15_15360, partial [FCB group bacterium]
VADRPVNNINKFECIRKIPVLRNWNCEKDLIEMRTLERCWNEATAADIAVQMEKDNTDIAFKNFALVSN